MPLYCLSSPKLFEPRSLLSYCTVLGWYQTAKLSEIESMYQVSGTTNSWHFLIYYLLVITLKQKFRRLSFDFLVHLSWASSFTQINNNINEGMFKVTTTYLVLEDVVLPSSSELVLLASQLTKPPKVKRLFLLRTGSWKPHQRPPEV